MYYSQDGELTSQEGQQAQQLQQMYILNSQTLPDLYIQNPDDRQRSNGPDSYDIMSRFIENGSKGLTNLATNFIKNKIGSAIQDLLLNGGGIMDSAAGAAGEAAASGAAEAGLATVAETVIEGLIAL